MALALRVVIDEVLDPRHTATGRAAEHLARALVATAPEGTVVEGIVSASSEDDYAELRRRLPGLERLHKSALARRELAAAWATGLVRAPRGMVHSPSLLAPLARHDRVATPGTQAVVTLLDAVLWTAPQTVSGRPLAWQRAMIRRAERHADALVVPSHAVAEAVAEHARFGDRVRVIPQAAAPGLTVPRDALERLDRLQLPGSYVLSFATANPRHQLDRLLEALAPLDAPLVLVHSGPRQAEGVDEVVAASRVPADRVIRLSALDRDDLAAVQAGAALFVQPSRDEGFGTSVLEAFALDVPVVTSDAPALVELSAGAALEVERGDEFTEGLRDAIERVLTDDDLADRMRIAGRDRARAFTWRDSAEKVWQLHADL
ncbi:MAG: glycosyltransferase family 1 protein [Microbacteriaceae bacterium]|nr:MAG: glycosyltransferase family 1 protein [Microbacteriaceae bacterium]